MRCRKIQELLKTDYLDGQVNPRQGQDIKEHLAKCRQCRRLEGELLAQRMLFQGAKRKQVPERVWQNIRDTIITERLTQEHSLSGNILQRLRESILAPRPVFALAGALTVAIFVLVLSGVFIQNRRSLSKVNVGESIVGYSLNGESGDFVYDLGTEIEEYFL